MAKEPERADGSSFHPTTAMKQPDPKLHQIISFAKSAIRILGCGVAAVTGSVVTLAVMLLIAELVGVVEELV